MNLTNSPAGDIAGIQTSPFVRCIQGGVLVWKSNNYAVVIFFILKILLCVSFMRNLAYMIAFNFIF